MRAPEIDFRCETEARKVMVDLHREPPEVGLVKKVNWKFVLVGEIARANVSLHREPPEVGLVKKLTMKFLLVGEIACANPTKRVLPHSLILG